MRHDETLGQVAYAAFAASMTARHASWGMPAFEDLRPAPDYQDAWEAAARAVLDAWQAACDALPVRKRGQAVCAQCSALLDPDTIYCPAHPRAEVYIMLEEETP